MFFFVADMIKGNPIIHNSKCMGFLLPGDYFEHLQEECLFGMDVNGLFLFPESMLKKTKSNDELKSFFLMVFH